MAWRCPPPPTSEYDGGSSQTSATVKGIRREVFSVGGLTFLRRCHSVKPAIKASASGAVNPPRAHPLVWLAPQTLYFPSQTERHLDRFFCPQRTHRKRDKYKKEIPDIMRDRAVCGLRQPTLVRAVHSRFFLLCCTDAKNN